MSYELTLSLEERKAIDWVDYRDWNGHDLYMQLWHNSEPEPDAEWDEPGDITFRVPEHVAWTIRDMYEASGHTVPHFTSPLADKIRRFIDAIV